MRKMAKELAISPNLRLKSGLTAATYFSYLVYALAFAMTFSFAFSKRDANHNLVSYLTTGFAIKNFARVVGYPINGYIFHRTNKQIGIILSLVLITIFSFANVATQNEAVYLVTNGILGLVLSMFNVCALSLMIDIWGGKCPPFLNGLYIIDGGIGLITGMTNYFIEITQMSNQMISPRIARDYLANSTFTTPQPMYMVESRTSSSYAVLVMLSLPSLVAILTHVALFVIQMRMARNHVQAAPAEQPSKNVVYFAGHKANAVPHPESQKVSKVELDEEHLPKKAVVIGAVIVGLSAAFFVDLALFVPLNIRNLIPPLEGQVPSLMVTLPIVSIFSGFGASKLLLTVLSVWVAPEKLVIGQLALITLSLPMFFLLGQFSSIWIVIGGALLGAGSSLEPNVISLLRRKGPLNNFAVGCLLFATNLGAVLIPAIGMTSVLREYSPFHALFASMSLTTIVSLLLLLLKKYK